MPPQKAQALSQLPPEFLSNGGKREFGAVFLRFGYLRLFHAADQQNADTGKDHVASIGQKIANAAGNPGSQFRQANSGAAQEPLIRVYRKIAIFLFTGFEAVIGQRIAGAGIQVIAQSGKSHGQAQRGQVPGGNGQHSGQNHAQITGDHGLFSSEQVGNGPGRNFKKKTGNMKYGFGQPHLDQ